MVGDELRRRGGPFTLVRSGTLRRQQDTAAHAHGELGDILLEQDPRWNEYDHLNVVATQGVGRASHDDPREFQVALDAALTNWVGRGDRGAAGESWSEFTDRVAGALDDVLVALGKGQRAVVFTSGGVIAALAQQLTGASPDVFVALNRVTVNGGITKIVSGRSGTTLLSFNEHAHFEAEAATLLSYR